MPDLHLIHLQGKIMTIIAKCIERRAYDTRSSGDNRFRVDAYFVLYCCPPDKYNPGPYNRDWICRFDVKRGEPFKMQDFASKDDAHKAKGWKL